MSSTPVKTRPSGIKESKNHIVSGNMLFFDGKCPICAKEIALLSKLKNDVLNLTDIHTLDHKQLDEVGVGKRELIKVLHFKTQNGAWLKGLDATVAAWRHTPYGWMLTPLRWPFIAPVADWFYYKWAEKRVCKLDYANHG